MSAIRTTNTSSEDTAFSASTAQTNSVNTLQIKSSTDDSKEDTIAPLQPGRSNRHVASSSNESTPIRRSDNHVNRSYNTSDSTLTVPSLQARAMAQVAQRTEFSDSTKTEHHHSWYKRIAEKYGSVTLENKASVARDHLALERTFLAWLRTSLSFASIGIAITQLFRLNASIPKNSSKRSHYEAYNEGAPSSTLPFSPYIGHTIPAEIIPYLQYMTASSADQSPERKLGPTLLDQLLSLSPDGSSVQPYWYSPFAFNDETANKLRHVGKPLGATFVGISVVVLIVGFQRYFEAQHWIIHGKFPASRGSISLVAFAALALIIASLVVIIVISPSSQET